MEMIKIHWNSVLLTPGMKYCTDDISNMYLCSKLPDAQYVRFDVKLIPPEIIEHYPLHDKIHNGYVYARIKQAWYGLNETGCIANKDIVAHLENLETTNQQPHLDYFVMKNDELP